MIFLNIFGDIEELVGDLYPYRVPITIALGLALVAALVFAYRMGWHLVVWRRRLISAAIAVPMLAVAIIGGNYLLSPLWERNTVCEASPIPGAGAGSEKCDDMAFAAEPTASPEATASPAPAATSTATPEPTAEPTFVARVRNRGPFHGADDFHFGRGDALLIESAPGQYVLRFENFSVRNGPDLYVYLSPDPGGDVDENTALNLGTLKGTDGAFNYDIPPGTDVSQYRSAVVWCRQFTVLFAAAPLEPA